MKSGNTLSKLKSLYLALLGMYRRTHALLAARRPRANLPRPARRAEPLATGIEDYLFYAVALGPSRLPVITDRTIMEEVVPETTWVVSTPFAKEHFGRGRVEGFAEGLAEGETRGFLAGEAQGITEGITEGRTEGRAEGEAQALLMVLNARHIAVSDEDAVRILSCADLRTLDLWLLRAATARKIEDIFDPEPVER